MDPRRLHAVGFSNAQTDVPLAPYDSDAWPRPQPTSPATNLSPSWPG